MISDLDVSGVWPSLGAYVLVGNGLGLIMFLTGHWTGFALRMLSRRDAG